MNQKFSLNTQEKNSCSVLWASLVNAQESVTRKEMEMQVFSGIARKMAGVAAALMIIAGAATVPASAKAYAYHGHWVTSAQLLDGEYVTKAQTEFNDGSILALVVTRNEVRIRLQDMSWNLSPGNEVRFRISVDGDGFKGVAEAVNRHEYEARDLTIDFLKQLVEGDQAIVEIDGTRWTTNLHGLKAALADALRRFG
jgi:hypothetical protein